MTPWEQTVTVTTTEDDAIIAIGCPGRCTLERICIVRLDAAAFTANFFNRAFTAPPVIASITSDTNISGYAAEVSQESISAWGDIGNRCLLTFFQYNPLKVGDVITIAHALYTGYNVAHRVVQIVNDKQVITDQEYVTDDYGGTGASRLTAALTIPTNEQILYKAAPELTGTGSADSGVIAYDYVNQDPQGNLQNRGFATKLYVELSPASTYRISIRAQVRVAST